MMDLFAHMTPERLAVVEQQFRAAGLAVDVQQAWLTAALGIAGLVGKLAGKLGGNRAEARAQEATLNQGQDAMNLQGAQVAQNNARQNLAADTGYRQTQQGNAVRAGLLAGAQDAKITRPAGIPTVEVRGGLRPSAIKNREAMGDQFQRDAMLRYMQGAPGLVTETPSTTPAPQAGKFDKFLNIVGGIGGLAGLGADIYGQTRGGLTPDISGAAVGVNSDPSALLRNVPKTNMTTIVPDDFNARLQRNVRPITFGGR